MSLGSDLDAAGSGCHVQAVAQHAPMYMLKLASFALRLFLAEVTEVPCQEPYRHEAKVSGLEQGFWSW